MAIPVITSYPMPAAADLPAGRQPWRLDPGRAALLIHDMQRYFLDFFPPGVPPVTDLVRNTALIRRAAADAGVPVVYTAQPGAMTRLDRGLLHDFWGPGMGSDPDARAIVTELAPGADDTVLTKWRYSAFVRSPLADLLREWGRTQLVICGVYAHVGCLMTANDAFALDVQPFLVADAIADFTASYHRLALDWAAERCAMPVTTAEAIDALQAAVSVHARSLLPRDCESRDCVILPGSGERRQVMKALSVLASTAVAAGIVVSAGCAHSDHAASTVRDVTHAPVAGCTQTERRAALAGDQRAVLATLGSLTTLRNQADADRLAALGYNQYAHWDTSLRGMGWSVANDLMHQDAHHPGFLFYRPRPGAPNGAHDGLDFPYRLVGWGYPLPYDWQHYPAALLPCVGYTDWFIHERGVHIYSTGGFRPVPPAETVRGTAPGADFPQVPPPDFGHPRSWDIHMFLSPSGVPGISILNRGFPVPGLGVPPFSFYHPPLPPAVSG